MSGGVLKINLGLVERYNVVRYWSDMGRIYSHIDIYWSYMAIWGSQCGNDNWQVVSSQQPAVLFIWTRTALSSALLSPEFYLYRLSSGWPAANREETFISAHLKSTHGTARRKCLLTFDNIFHVRERERSSCLKRTILLYLAGLHM